MATVNATTAQETVDKLNKDLAPDANPSGKIAMISRTGGPRMRGGKVGSQGYVIPADQPLVLDLADVDPVTLRAIETDKHILVLRTDTPVTPAGDVKRFLQQ